MPRSNLARAPTSPAARGSTTRSDARSDALARVPAHVAATARAPERRAGRRFVALTWLALAAISAAGARYYVLPRGARVRDPLHPWLRPSGYVGQSAGLLALAIFLLLWLYPLRKRYRALAFTGSIGRWLDVHVTAALAIPLLIAIHSSWRLDGLIGLGAVSMLIVWASGLVGRYLYTRIPRSRSGIELTIEEVSAQRHALVGRIAATTGLDPATIERTLDADPSAAADGNPLRVLGRLVANDLTRWRTTRMLRRRWARVRDGRHQLDRRALAEVVRLASREMALAQQARMLDATHRVFRYWHVAHRPFAITALVAVVIHVAVVVAVGATWFW
jgi:hypothetical protein